MKNLSLINTYSLKKPYPSHVQVSCLISGEAGEVMCSSFIYSIVAEMEPQSSVLMFGIC